MIKLAIDNFLLYLVERAKVHNYSLLVERFN